MIIKSLLMGLTFLVFTTGGFSFEYNELSETVSIQGRIIHVPVSSMRENEKLVVEARVDGNQEPVVFIRLYFKSKGDQSFDYIEMRKETSGYFGELEPSKFSPPELEYFILALLSDQTVITYPEWNPYGNPIVVSIASQMAPVPEPDSVKPDVSEVVPLESAPEKISPSLPEDEYLSDESPVLILSPEEGEKFNVGEEVVIAASFITDENTIDINSINLFVDDSNVTIEAEISENLLTYSTSVLEPGNHQILIQGYYTSGVELSPTIWSFTIVGKQKRASSESIVRGRVFAETRQENISTKGFDDNIIGGSFYGKYGITKFDARLYLTSRESKRFQPRNRYSINIELPVLGVTFGDTYPRFNDLMLWGKRVRGIYGRLHLGFFNVDVVHGETIRQVAAEREIVINPTTNTPFENIAGEDSTVLVPTGIHRQRLFGIRQSFGSGKNFQLGFNFLKVRDDTTSLASGESSQSPQDNLVIGSDLLIAFDHHRFELRGGAALSFLTKDISNGPLNKTKIEEQFGVNLPFDPEDFKDFLIINTSTVPLDPRDLSSLAWNFNFKFDYFNNNFQFGYKSIGSQYNSLGNTFLRTDLQGFFVRDRFRLYKNKIYLNFGFENYDDNFSKDNENPITKLKTFNYGFSIYPGPGLPNLNFNLRNHDRNNNKTTLDSLFTTNQFNPTGQDTTLIDNREKNTTRDWSVQVNYDVNLLQLNHSITLSYITSDRDDRFRSNLSNVASNIQLFTVRTEYQFPLTTTFSFARNDNKFAAGSNTFNFKMLGAKAEYFLFNRRLKTYFSTNFTTASGTTAISDSTQSVTDYKRTAFNIGASFEIAPGHSILVDGHIIRFNNNGGTLNTNTKVLSLEPSFTDRILRIYYEKRF
ncbi:MAG: hypothetical protein ACE5JB_03400 [bacterium]